MPISSQQHREKTGNFQVKRSHLLNKIIQPVSSIPDFDSSFQVPYIQDYSRAIVIQTWLFFSRKQSVVSHKLCLLILLALIAPTMGETTFHVSQDSIKANPNKNNEATDYSLEPSLSNSFLTESLSDSAVYNNDFYRIAKARPLFSKEKFFDQATLYKKLEALSSSNSKRPAVKDIGFCEGLIKLFSLLDPVEISNFIKDSTFKKPETEVLLAYIIQVQKPGYKYTYPPQKNLVGNYVLKLRDGTILHENYPSDLLDKLYKKGKNVYKGILKKAAPIKVFFSNLEQYLMDGKIYSLQYIATESKSKKIYAHVMLVQKENSQIRFFDPNTGFWLFQNAKEIYRKLSWYLRGIDNKIPMSLVQLGGAHTNEEAKKVVSNLKLNDVELPIFLENLISNDDLDTFSATIDKFFSKNKAERNGNRLLQVAINYENPRFVEWLYKNTQIDSQTHKNLCQAAEIGNIDVLKIVLSHEPNSINKVGPDDFSPVYLASQYGNKECVQTLLEAGADPNFRRADGWTPLIIAAYYGYADIVQLLLEANPYYLSQEISYALKSAKDDAVIETIKKYAPKKKTGTTPFAKVVESQEKTPKKTASKEMKSEL